jgi:hypothetical protein
VADSEPTFSSDGKKIAFRRIIGPEEASTRVEGIFIVGLDGSNLHQVTNVQKRGWLEFQRGALEFEDFGPAFSPDGDRLVFERSRLEDDRSAVFVQSLDSSGLPEDAHQITPWFMGCGDGPEFSPKGYWMLFSCTTEDGSSNLYRVHPLYWVHPIGIAWLRFGLEQLTPTGADKHYVGSSFSPEFKEVGDEVPWNTGSIVAARYPAYGDEGNSDVFGMHIEGAVVPSETGNFTKSETLDDHPSWGTHPPSLKSLCCPRARN